MALIQLDLFSEDAFKFSEHEMLLAEFEKVKDSCNRVRKKQFSEIGSLKKMMTDLSDRFEVIERFICSQGNSKSEDRNG